MTLVKFNPGRTLRRDHSMTSFDNIFNDFFNHNFEMESNIATRPMANIKETTDHIVLDIAVPGFEKDDFSISLENKVLNISLLEEEVKNDDKMLRSEYNFNGFNRSFRIGNSINPDKIQASYVNGILEIVLEKKEEEKEKPTRVIEVK